MGCGVRFYNGRDGLLAVDRFTSGIVSGEVGLSQRLGLLVQRDLAGAEWHTTVAGSRRLRRFDMTTNLAAVIAAALCYHAGWEKTAIPDVPAAVEDWNMTDRQAREDALAWA